jgi:hypothetical protein
MRLDPPNSDAHNDLGVILAEARTDSRSGRGVYGSGPDRAGERRCAREPGKSAEDDQVSEMSTEWKALAKIEIHHEAMKKSGFQTLGRALRDAHLAEVFQKVEPALLHGFMVYSLLARAFHSVLISAISLTSRSPGRTSGQSEAPFPTARANLERAQRMNQVGEMTLSGKRLPRSGYTMKP